MTILGTDIHNGWSYLFLCLWHRRSGLVGHNGLVGHTDLISLINLINNTCIVGCILVGLMIESSLASNIRCIGPIGHSCLIGLIKLVKFIGLVGHNGLIGHISLIGFGLNNLIDIDVILLVTLASSAWTILASPALSACWPCQLVDSLALSALSASFA